MLPIDKYFLLYCEYFTSFSVLPEEASYDSFSAQKSENQSITESEDYMSDDGNVFNLFMSNYKGSFYFLNWKLKKKNV